MLNKLRISITAILLVFSLCISAAPKTTQEKCELHPNTKGFLEKLDTQAEVDAFLGLFNNLRADNKTLLTNMDVITELTKFPPIGDSTLEDWWDKDLEVADVKKIWDLGKRGGLLEPLRKKLESILRGGGGEHEWCLVCKAPIFKDWGLRVSDIQTYVTKTKDLEWTIPADVNHSNAGDGKRYKHGETGSNTFHILLGAEIEKINATDLSAAKKIERYNDFLKDICSASKWNCSPKPPEIN